MIRLYFLKDLPKLAYFNEYSNLNFKHNLKRLIYITEVPTPKIAS